MFSPFIFYLYVTTSLWRVVGADYIKHSLTTRYIMNFKSYSDLPITWDIYIGDNYILL